jgi:hypothetical protein
MKRRFFMSILFAKEPLVVNTELAETIGLNESIVLQQLHYWVEINRKAKRNYQDGKYWTYNSIQAWRDENFRFWSVDTVKRTLASLEKDGYIISGNFNTSKMDRTKWYTVNYDALNALGQNAPMHNDAENELQNVEKPHNGALVQNAPMQKGNLPRSISATCPNALGQNAPSNTRDLLTENSTDNSLKDLKRNGEPVFVDDTPKGKSNSSKSKSAAVPYNEIIDEAYAENAEAVRTVFHEFVKMRKAINKPMTARAFSNIIQKLFSMTPYIDEQIKIIDQSITNAWAGVFPLKQDHTGASGNDTQNPFLRQVLKRQQEETAAGRVDITPEPEKYNSLMSYLNKTAGGVAQ